MKRRIILLLLSAIMVTGMTACKERQSQTSESQEQSESVVETEPQSDMSDYGMQISEKEGKMDPDYMDAYTEFAVSLLKNTAEKEENSMVSPLSAATALMLVENGASDDTLNQMQQLFGNIPLQAQNRNFIYFADQLTNHEGARLKQANAIWLNEIDDFEVNADYLSEMQNKYSVKVEQEPFSNETAAHINDWVKEMTNGDIEQLVEQIKDKDRAYLLNAVSFEALWQEAYEDSQVREGEFYAADGTTQQVAMMSSTEHGFLVDGTTTGFMKNYQEGYRFVALLPAEGMDIDEYLSDLTGEKFTTLLQNIRAWDMVQTKMPKFTSSYSVSLKSALQEMGMKDAFDPQKAKLDGIGSCDGGILCIDDVLQKTYIQVNETGTKASAATSVEIVKETAASPTEMKTVVLDRPFVYAIIDEKTELPIFMGVVKQV